MTVTDYRAAAREGRVVPVIDIGAWASGDPAARARIAAEVDAACCEIGFFLVTGHGVAPDLISVMYEVTAAFFALPLEYKESLRSPSGNTYRGWKQTLAKGDDAGKPVRESLEVGAYDSADEILAAAYDRRWAEGYDPNIWPDQPADLRSTWLAYRSAVRGLADRLLEISAVALGLEPEWFEAKFDKETSYLSGNLYPPVEARGDDDIRFPAHTDIGSLTVLYQDTGPGSLQVLDRLGRWCDVEAVPGTFVVNLGDMLAKWTNDRWVATRHRVKRLEPGAEPVARISLPFFQHPNFDALVECIPTCTGPDRPPKYEPVLGGDWANHRFATETYA
jgi:isopenicillin N synthase-like dioxygenase